MALARLTKQCRECPFVETCEHKEVEALGYLNDCLAEPSNTNSHKPMNYESKNNS